MNLELRPPAAPPQLVGQAPLRDPASGEPTDVLKAALAGNARAVDQAELDYLNLLVRIGEFGVHYPDGEPHEIFGPRAHWPEDARRPFVLHLARGAGPDGRTLLVWTLGEPCRRCIGLLRRRPCNVCGGTWFVDRGGDDFEWLVYSDIDGVLVGEEVD